MSQSDVARSERVLAKVGAALGITAPGREWLVAAVDPFHDTPLNVCGYPDTNEAASVCQVVRLSQTISAPSTIPNGENWDCHIHSFPWLVPQPGLIGVFTPSPAMSPNYGPFKVTNINLNTTAAYGSIGVHSVVSGANTWDSSADSTAISFPFNPALTPYLQGEFRVIAKGYEVINTTSDLNIQGLVTVYRQPFADFDTAKAVSVFTPQEGGGPTTSAVGYPDCVFTDQPPQTSGSALLLDSSKQWKAKEGVYIADTLNSEEVPAGVNMSAIMMRPATTDSNYTAAASGNSAWIVGLGATQIMSIPPTTPTNTLYAFLVGGELPTKFNQSGAYFTGLSYTSTLQLNSIWYIERFPTQQDSDLVVLAKHSCRSDTVARSLYSEIIREMPVGVPQRMNGLGEWFADAVSSAADFVAPVLGAIPTPMTQGLSGIVKAAGGVAKSLGSKREAMAPYSATGSNTAVPVKNREVVVVKQVQKKKAKAKGKVKTKK